MRIGSACVALVLAVSLNALGQTTRPTIPPTEATAKAALAASPRHGEFVDIPMAGKPALHCWVVYPETKDKAPVVLLIHEIFGLSEWARGTADQLASEGFIVIAPDFLSGLGPNGGGTDSFPDRAAVTGSIGKVKPEDVIADLNAARDYGLALPSASGKTGVIGFCWGGGKSFDYAVNQPNLNAAVVCYGGAPKEVAAIEKIKAPVLGLYGADDARITATVAPTEALMKTAGKTYTHHEYPGAGHGFFRQQDGRDGANLKAAQQGWAEAVAFLKANTR